MKTITPQEVHAHVASSVGPLVVCFLKAQGCPNCEQTKPVLAAMEEANQQTQFLSVTVADGSEVTPGFQFRMFPGIFSFHDGKLIRAFSGAKTARQLSFMFSLPNDLKVAAWDAREAATFIENELKEYNQGCGYAAPTPVPATTSSAPVSPECERCLSACQPNDSTCVARCEKWCAHRNVTHVTPAVMPPEGDPLEAGCDSCQ